MMNTEIDYSKRPFGHLYDVVPEDFRQKVCDTRSHMWNVTDAYVNDDVIHRFTEFMADMCDYNNHWLLDGGDSFFQPLAICVDATTGIWTVAEWSNYKKDVVYKKYKTSTLLKKLLKVYSVPHTLPTVEEICNKLDIIFPNLENMSVHIYDEVSPVYESDYMGLTSCMVGTEYVKFYDEQENIQIMVVKIGDKALSRAILWTLDSGEKYLDRIYSASPAAATLMRKYCDDNGILRDLDAKNPQHTVTCKPSHHGLPYLDSFINAFRVDADTVVLTEYSDSEGYKRIKKGGFLAHDGTSSQCGGDEALMAEYIQVVNSNTPIPKNVAVEFDGKLYDIYNLPSFCGPEHEYIYKLDTVVRFSQDYYYHWKIEYAGNLYYCTESCKVKRRKDAQ